MVLKSMVTGSNILLQKNTIFKCTLRIAQAYTSIC